MGGFLDDLLAGAATSSGGSISVGRIDLSTGPAKRSFLASWLRHLQVRDGGKLQRDSEDSIFDHNDEDRPPTENLDEANLVTSIYKGEGIETHALLLDLDVEHTYVPSSKPGHGHLLVKTKLSRGQWEKVMRALAEAGVVENGYTVASISRGYAALRLPWVKKTLGQIKKESYDV